MNLVNGPASLHHHRTVDCRKQVLNGYDAMATAYLGARAQEGPDVDLLDEFERLVPEGSAVLDAGCGAGKPIASRLSERYMVTGVDFSKTQLSLATQLVPRAEFVCQDLTALDLPVESFDAVVSYYAIIHIPREEHPLVFSGIHRVLKPSGPALLCIGASDISSDWQDYHGVPMFWSHFAPETGVGLLRACGFEIVWSRVVSEMTELGGEHLFVLCRKV